MNTIHHLRKLGQSLWLDSISRQMLDDGRLRRYASELAVTGLTSNPTIFDEAIGSGAYDEDIARKSRAGKSGESLFTELALADLRRAAELFRPEFDRTDGVDGWVSMELSPLLAADTAGSVRAAAHIHQAGDIPNLFVKIPGTPEGVPAIEESIFNGVPVNVTLLFSPEQYLASANAYLRGIERRIAAGKSPLVTSVASLFVSRWDRAVADKVPHDLHNRLGIAVAQRTYVAYLGLYATPRWKELASAGARPQRMLWASTGTKDPKAPESLYAEAFAAPDTIDTLPEKTLLALAKIDALPPPMPTDGADSAHVLAEFSAAGIDIDALGLRLQREGAEAFVKSWRNLMSRIEQRGSGADLRATAGGGTR
jgi:transaldolase